MARVSVIGAGYLGATHAACMAELGHEVIAVDVDEAKLSKFRAGELPFFEPGLDDLFQRNLAAGRLRFTASYREAASFADAHFLAVGTPQQSDGQAADLSYPGRQLDLRAHIGLDEGETWFCEQMGNVAPAP